MAESDKILVQVFVTGIETAHIFCLHTGGPKFSESLPPCLIVVEESPNRVDSILMNIGNGSREIADGVQHKAGSGFLPFYRKMGKEIHKALEETECFRSIPSNQAYILWSDCSLECLVVPKLIPSSTVEKTDGRILSSIYGIANMTEIRACNGKVYLAYFSEIALQMQGNSLLMERIRLVLVILGAVTR